MKKETEIEFRVLEKRRPKHATYYDIDISVGELLRFLWVREEKREWKSTKSTSAMPTN